jgi:DNA-binding response OmpR family regulator
MRALFVTAPALVKSLQRVLKEEGVEVELAEEASRADLRLTKGGYDVVLFDPDHLGRPGYSRLQRWRDRGLKAHVLALLPCDCGCRERVDAFDAGADGYLLQPFCVEEVRARFRALSRRVEERGPVLLAHDLEIDLYTRCARRAGRPIELTRREFDLLQLLASQQGRVLSRTAIFNHLYEGRGRDDHSNVIDVYVSYLRNKIDKGFDKPLILTSRGEGYLLRAQGA